MKSLDTIKREIDDIRTFPSHDAAGVCCMVRKLCQTMKHLVAQVEALKETEYFSTLDKETDS